MGSCGRIYNWPGYNPRWDGPTLSHLIHRVLRRATGWEGVARVRVSEGLRLGRHHGPMGSLRHGSDIRLPVLEPDTAFAVEIQYDGKVEAARSYVQCAYLYTTGDGQRRIRVSTAAAGELGELGELRDAPMHLATDGRHGAAVIYRTATRGSM